MKSANPQYKHVFLGMREDINRVGHELPAGLAPLRSGGFRDTLHYTNGLLENINVYDVPTEPTQSPFHT